MMNYSHSTDVYKIWADMACYGHSTKEKGGPDRFCVFIGTKDTFRHTHDRDEILSRYGSRITMCQRMPDVFVAAMGNQMYMALLDTEDEVREYVTYVLDEQGPLIMPTLYN